MNIETLLANITSYTSPNDPHAASHIPIYQTATFDLKKQQGDSPYDYSRSGNPTREALESIFTLAEKGAGSVCTNTGLSALALLFDSCLSAGDRVLVEKDCYGGTYRLLKSLDKKYGIRTHFADFTQPSQLEDVLKKHPIKLVLCESPTNPGLKVIDLKRTAQLAHSHGCLMAVDNSLATFASQQPLTLGADFSLFSTTKYISGHGSVTAGALVWKSHEWTHTIRYEANAQGRAQSPMEVFLTSLGLPTLVCRMRAQETSALKIAQYLQTHPAVVKVTFPGLESHPQHALAREQMKIIPGIITMDLSSPLAARNMVNQSRLFGEKASFGTADSRIEIPVEISHATYSQEDLAAIGLSPATVRLSIGLENTEDLLEDITTALK